MTATIDNPIQIPTPDLGGFLKEHGEIETILPVIIGVLITRQFQLRGANALLVNLLVASIARQIFIQLKQEQTPAIPAAIDNNPAPLEDYSIAHAVPGRVRLRMPRLAVDSDFARRLEQALKADEYVKQVRINPDAASIAINYDNLGLSDWELGMRLMGIVNEVKEGA